MQVSFHLAPALEKKLRYQTSEISAAVRQGNDAIKSQAGVFSFIAPKFAGIKFKTPSKAMISPPSAIERESFASEDAWINIPVAKNAIDNEVITFSEAPVQLRFFEK